MNQPAFAPCPQEQDTVLAVHDSDRGTNHIERCESCQALHDDSRTIAALLDLVPVPEPDPTRWSQLSAHIAQEIALNDSREACPEFAEHFALASEEEPDPVFEAHLTDCENCRRALHEVEAVGELLDMASVPPPDPVRWANMSDRVLAIVEPDPSLKTPSKPAPLVFPSLFLKVAAAVLLMVCGALGAHYWPSQPLSKAAVEALHARAEGLCEQGRFGKAEELLQEVIEQGSARPDCHAMVARTVTELEALRRYRALPSPSKARQQALARFIYAFPASQMTRRALAEYSRLKAHKSRKPSRPSPEQAFDDLPQPTQGFVRLDNVNPLRGQQDFEAVLVRTSHPAIRDAAQIQLALLAMRQGQSQLATQHFEKVSGQSPAARFAQEQLERLKTKR